MIATAKREDARGSSVCCSVSGPKGCCCAKWTPNELGEQVFLLSSSKNPKESCYFFCRRRRVCAAFVWGMLFTPGPSKQLSFDFFRLASESFRHDVPSR